MAIKRDYYEVLGIDKSASESQIKNAFRSLARKFHPDKNPNDPEAELKFKEIQESYTILSNPEQRKNYDMFGHNRPGGSPFGPRGFQGVNISIDDLFGGGFESIFSQFFGGTSNSGSRGSDLLVRHSVPFQAAMDGMDDELEIEALKDCSECEGSGSKSAEGARSCPSCDGRGRIDEISMIGPFRQRVRRDCPSCRGSGRIVSDPCRDCKGEGRVFQAIRVKFSVHPGVDTGTRLRMKGQGEAASSLNGQSGDLYIELEVDSHQWFERDGSDLLMALPLSFADLTLGTTVEIAHIDSKSLQFKVPSGSSPGETITILGRGLPSSRGGSRRGSVTAVLKLEVPRNLPRAIRKKIVDMRDELEGELKPLEDRIRNEARSRRSG
ncbi:MAG: J domain-containing protein [Candidatus Thermoplasmatota archaeon]|nr:J domain-containing protein [Candidatus Thermoplasmatota archaeon]